MEDWETYHPSLSSPVGDMDEILRKHILQHDVQKIIKLNLF